MGLVYMWHVGRCGQVAPKGLSPRWITLCSPSSVIPVDITIKRPKCILIYNPSNHSLVLNLCQVRPVWTAPIVFWVMLRLQDKNLFMFLNRIAYDFWTEMATLMCDQSRMFRVGKGLNWGCSLLLVITMTLHLKLWRIVLDKHTT